MIEIPEYLLKNESPFLVCSKSVLRGQVDELKNLDLDVFYSTKTNSEASILKELKGLGVGFSVSSPDEFLAVVSMGAKPDKLLYYERGLTEKRVKWLVQSGCKNFIIESKAAFDNLLPHMNGGSILIRIKAMGVSNKYSGKYKPGLEIEEAKELLEKIKGIGLQTGILHHDSSQVEDSGVWKKKFEMLSKFDVDIIDIGGGIPIAYDGEKLEHILDEIKVGVGTLKAKRIIIEPGRFIVGPACSLVTKVALVDGNNAILNCSVYNVHIDTIIANLILPCRTLKEGKGGEYRLLGSSLCNLDVFNQKVKLPELEEGDAVVFDKAGAYNFSSEFGFGSGIETYITD